jgi:O-antigen ligase
MQLLKIDLKKLSVIPALMMFVFAAYISISFNAIEMRSASYLLLGMMLLTFLGTCYLLIRERTIPLMGAIFFTFIVMVGLMSVITDMEWKEWTYSSVSVLMLLTLFHYYRDDIRPLIIGAAIGFSIAVYMQLYQCVTHPELWLVSDSKLNSGYVLGDNYNGIGCRVICAFVANALCLKITKWWWMNIIPLVVSSFAILFMVQSMTALSSMFILVLLCLIPHTLLQRLSAFGVFIASVLFEVLVCFQGKGIENNDTARWFIIEVLGKDVTFSLRTEKWDAAFRLFTESPIWGYGYPTDKWYYAYLSSHAMGPHNFLLGLMLFGGVIGVGLFFWAVYLAYKRLLSYHDVFSNVVLATSAVFCLMMLMECYSIQYPIMIVVLAYYYGEFEKVTRKNVESPEFDPLEE